MLASIMQLLTPLNYLRIKAANKKWFDIYFPFGMSIVIISCIYLLPGVTNILESGGLVEGVASLLPMLAGFYIAALAAVATFSREGIDEPLSGDPATLRMSIKGKSGNTNLSRRQFVCYLFGYMSFLCIFLYLYSVVSIVLHENIKALLHVKIIEIVRLIFIFTYALLFTNLVITTLVGLHYLSDRLNRA